MTTSKSACFTCLFVANKLLREHMNIIHYIACPYMPAEADATYAAAAVQTGRIETQQRHVLELHTKALEVVQDLEIHLGIQMRWRVDDDNWATAATLVQNRRYQHAIDELEGLIIARMFELTKVNMSDTGAFPLCSIPKH